MSRRPAHPDRTEQPEEPEQQNGQQDVQQDSSGQQQDSQQDVQQDSSGQQQDGQQESSQQESSPSRTAAEWIVFTVAALVVAAVVAVIGAQSLGTRGPPSFTTTAGPVAERNGAHYVTVTVENVGDITASDVKVGAQLRQDGRTVEQATQMINFLAGDERRQVTFVFEGDPGALELHTGVFSFRTT